MEIHAWKRNELEAENLEEKANFSLLYKPIKLIMVFNTSDKRFLSKWNRYHNHFFFTFFNPKEFSIASRSRFDIFGFYRNLFCYLRQNSKFDFLFFFSKKIFFFVLKKWKGLPLSIVVLKDCNKIIKKGSLVFKLNFDSSCETFSLRSNIPGSFLSSE